MTARAGSHGALVVLLLAAAACGGGSVADDALPADAPVRGPADRARPGGDSVVTFTAREHAFEGPSRIPAGATRVRVVNAGSEPHQVQLFQLHEGYSAAQLGEALRGRGPGPVPPDWAEPAGGPNAVAPGGEAVATVDLVPGRYAVADLIPLPAGVPNAAEGMVADLQVVAPQRGELPPGDVTMELDEYAFRTSGALAPGLRTVRVRNVGVEPHEVVVFRLAEGKTLTDLLAWSEGEFAGSPPAQPVGGITAIAPGAEAAFTVDLEAGAYALLCYVPDEEDGRPHVAHGMATQLDVR